jgi:formiminotetrahydrofolate cyclodeaminase
MTRAASPFFPVGLCEAVCVARSEPDLPAIDAFVSGVGGDDIRASSGAVAALAVALAADLTSQVARASPEWSERGGALAQADAVRDRAIEAAAEVGHAYQVALATLSRTLAQPTAAPVAGAPDLGEALERAVEPLLQVGEAASDASELAALVARSGASLVRADAVAATILATAAAEICAHLVEVNLLVTGDDERARRAREIVASASASREAARALGR